MENNKDTELEECRSCKYCDLTRNQCYITEEICYNNYRCLHEDCKSYREGANLLEPIGIHWVPIVDGHFVLPDTVKELLEIATGKSVIDGGMREGLVFRSQDGTKSFKAVSNEFLLKYHQ